MSSDQEKYEIPVDDEKVVAVHHESDSSEWVFFAHGLGSNKEGSYERRSEIVNDLGLNAVRFDFRGNGESDGDFGEKNLSTRIEDLKAVVEFFDPETFYIFASSIGCKTTGHSLAELNPDAVFLRAPDLLLRSTSDLERRVEEEGEFEFIEGKPLNQQFFEDLNQYPFEEVVEEFDFPVYIFQGAEDESVPLEDTLEVVEKLDCPVVLNKLPGEGHRFSDAAEDLMMNWISQIIG